MKKKLLFLLFVLIIPAGVLSQTSSSSTLRCGNVLPPDAPTNSLIPPIPLTSPRSTNTPSPTETPLWVKIAPNRKYFEFPDRGTESPVPSIPIGYLENINVSSLRYLIPDRANYNEATPRAYLNRYDSHQVSVMRVFMESPLDSGIHESIGYPFTFEEPAGSSECKGNEPNINWELTGVHDKFIRLADS